MNKKMRDLQPGEIVRTEYGDYGNFVTVVVSEVIIAGTGMYNGNIKGKFFGTNQDVSMWGNPDEMIELVESKGAFVEKYLKPLLSALDEGITNAEYKKIKDDEFVVITYFDGNTISVNVHMDSYFALACDVLKSL